MPLGMEVGLGPGDVVLDGDPAPLSRKRGRSHPQIFSPCLLWPDGFMDQDGTWHGGDFVLDGNPVAPPQKGGGAPFQFSAHKFQRVSRLGFVTAPTSLNGGQPNFARCLAIS